MGVDSKRTIIYYQPVARPRTIEDGAILTAAGRVLYREGYGGLTLHAVAAEVGLSPATLLQRFGSKRGLLLAAAQAAVPGAGAELRAAREAHRSPLRALSAGLTAMAEPVGTREAMAHGLSFLQLDIGDPEFAEHAQEWATRVRREIRDLLDTAVEAGELKRSNTARLAELVETVYHGALVGWALSGERRGLEAWLRRQLESALAPIRTPRGPARSARRRAT